MFETRPMRGQRRGVPLHVLVDGTDLRDGVDDVPYDIHDRARVTTSSWPLGRMPRPWPLAMTGSRSSSAAARAA